MDVQSNQTHCYSQHMKQVEPKFKTKLNFCSGSSSVPNIQNALL
jgi:hypothetical protein